MSGKIDINSKITDTQENFEVKTFTGYKKPSVFTELHKSILNSRIEELCFWIAEIHISGYIEMLWDKLIIFSSKLININNPKLSNYLYQEYQQYLELTKLCKSQNFIELRNSYYSRQQLHKIGLILSQSKKINIPNIPKIYTNDFDILNIQSKLMAKDTKLLDKVFQENDPNELKISINEFLYHLVNKNLNWSLYWLSWILEYEKKIIKKDKHFHCHTRKIENIDSKFYKDLSWLLWNCLFITIDDNNKIEYIKYIYMLYKIKFSKSKKNSRVPLLIHAILLIIENIDTQISLIQDKEIIDTVLGNIDSIYYKIQNNKTNDEVLQKLQSYIDIDNTTNDNYNNNDLVNNVLANKEEYLKKSQEKSKKKKDKNTLNEVSRNKIDTIMKINSEVFNLR